MRRSGAIAALVLLTWAMATPAAGAGAGAISLTFNVSARAEGAGGAGVANVWGGDTDLWANPALLAFRPGVRFGTMHSQLAEGLADDIFIDKQELTFGFAGIGVLYAQAPFDHVHLDMGEQTAVDEVGNVIGTFESWEKSRSFGLAVGVTQVTDHFLGTNLNGWIDLGLGYVWRDFEDQLAPDSVIQDAVTGGAKASSTDRGYVLRVTPLNTGDHIASLADKPVGLVAEASYGRSKTNATDEFLVRTNVDQADPMPTAYVAGWNTRVAIVPGRELFAAWPELLREAVNPLFAWTYGEQKIEPGYVWTGTDYVYEHDTSGVYDEDGRGHEFLILNVVYVRRGHVTYVPGDIDGITKGWGINVQAGRYGGVRYDHATVPQASGLPDVDREGWHFWVDVVALLDR